MAFVLTAFESKAAEIIGLYLKPPAHAAVFCVDEKSAIQALDRRDPVLPLSPGRAERHGFEYFRHGTLSLYAALEVSSGQVLGKTTQRHTSAEFVAFLADVVATQAEGKQIHVIADNLSAHKTKAVAEFLAAHPNIQLHYTPTYSSWLNQVEIWFSKIQRDLITRGIFTSKADLTVSCLSQDLAGGRVQGRIERKSAVAKVFESVTFGPSGREWQDGIQTIKGLNGTLFIDTENSRMGRRLQIETDDSSRLLLELGVIADHVVATPVRLQPRLGPHPGHTHMVNAERGPQLAAAPVGRTISGLAVQTPVDDPSFEFLDSFTGRTSTVPTPESGQTLFFKAVP